MTTQHDPRVEATKTDRSGSPALAAPSAPPEPRSTPKATPAAGQPTDPEPASPDVEALLSELHACLSVGVTPDGWTHELHWEGTSGTSRAWAVGGLVTAASAIVAGVQWGWGAALAGAVTALGVSLLVSALRSGPKVGDELVELFIPPDAVLYQRGIAGHQLVQVSRSRPRFERRRPASAADRRSVGWDTAGMGAVLALCGALSLLELSAVITPVAYLRTVALVGAALMAWLAVVVWRRIGRMLPILKPEPAASDAGTVVSELIDGASSGSSAANTLVSSGLSRLRPATLRVVVPALILALAGVYVLAAFQVVPSPDNLWSGLAATADLTAFVAAAANTLTRAVIGAVQRNGAMLWYAAKAALLGAVLLLLAWWFDWLDSWGDAVAWVRDLVG